MGASLCVRGSSNGSARQAPLEAAEASPSSKSPSRLRPSASEPWHSNNREQAGHNGELVHAVEPGAIAREDVSELGTVLGGLVP
jgi:hypothetical protein